MDRPFWKFVWKIALLVGIATGVLAIVGKVYPNNIPMNVTFVIAGVCLLVGVIGLALDINARQPWSQERRILLGSWKVEKEGRDYEAIWTFGEDETATVETKEYLDHGRWRLKWSHMRVTWGSLIPETKKHCYETFRRPLKTRGVQGRSWEDDRDGVPKEEGCVRAKKIEDIK